MIKKPWDISLSKENKKEYNKPDRTKDKSSIGIYFVSLFVFCVSIIVILTILITRLDHKLEEHETPIHQEHFPQCKNPKEVICNTFSEENK